MIETNPNTRYRDIHRRAHKERADAFKAVLRAIFPSR